MDLDVLVDIRKGTQTWGSYWCRRPPGRDLNPTPPEAWILCMAKLTQACLRFYFWTRIKTNSNSRYQLMHVCHYDVTAYLDEGEHNIIAADWSRLTPGPCYPTAVYNARFAGKCIAQIVQEIRLSGASDIHVVGFSLGAHVAAFAANNLRPYKLPRITGSLTLQCCD
jgi:hypothetical protein